MNSHAPNEVQERFHRYVAVLFAVTLPALAVVEMTRVMAKPTDTIRWGGYVVLTLWALHIHRSDKPNAVGLVMSTIAYAGSLVVVETLFGASLSAFDFTTTFGLVMVLSVLGASLFVGRRLLWTGLLSFGVAMWVVVVGAVEGVDPEVLGVRAVIAVAGIVFTTALVSGLFDQLSLTIERYDLSARLQDAIARCSEALLVHSDSFAAYEAVKALRRASNAEYAYIDRVTGIDGEPGWRIVADAAKHSSGYGPPTKEGFYSATASAYSAFLSRKAVITRTAELAPADAEHYLDHGILTQVSVPIFVADKFRGTIGFTQYDTDRKWDDAEIQTLWRAAHMIGAYWRRQDDAHELRATAESKDRLLASVSHEIRTPLTAIVGLSEEIAASSTSLGAEELDELNSIIAVQSRELAELVEDLLVASRADFGNLSIRPEAIDLMDQAAQVLRGVRESHPSTKQIIVDGGMTKAWADPLRVRQVMRNLITNAIKYGGDKVVVGVREDNGMAQLVVADDGPGVPIDESDLIFERYYRSAQSPTQPGSVGIGLAVSRQLAEMMGGTLQYVNGGRHRFELSLPMVVPPSVDEMAAGAVTIEV